MAISAFGGGFTPHPDIFSQPWRQAGAGQFGDYGSRIAGMLHDPVIPPPLDPYDPGNGGGGPPIIAPPPPPINPITGYPSGMSPGEMSGFGDEQINIDRGERSWPEYRQESPGWLPHAVGAVGGALGIPGLGFLPQIYDASARTGNLKLTKNLVESFMPPKSEGTSPFYGQGTIAGATPWDAWRGQEGDLDDEGRPAARPWAPQPALRDMAVRGVNDPWLTGGTDYLNLTNFLEREAAQQEDDYSYQPGDPVPPLAPNQQRAWMSGSRGLPSVEDISQRADAVINGDGPPVQLAVTDFILPAIGRLLGGQPPTPTPAPPPGQQRHEPAFPYNSSPSNPFRDIRDKYGPDPIPEFRPFNIPLFEGGDEWTLANERDALEDEAAAEAAQRAEEAAQREADLDYYYDEMAGEYG